MLLGGTYNVISCNKQINNCTVQVQSVIGQYVQMLKHFFLCGNGNQTLQCLRKFLVLYHPQGWLLVNHGILEATHTAAQVNCSCTLLLLLIACTKFSEFSNDWHNL